MLLPTYDIPSLPLAVDLETKAILKALSVATRALAELKGRAAAIPNQGILIDTLYLQEAKASSEIENIVTTHDELLKADLFPNAPQSVATKEVANYRMALRCGFIRMKESEGLILNSALIEMFNILKNRHDGFRTTPGTVLRNDITGETVFVPPQDNTVIIAKMNALETFINDDPSADLDPLIKMAIIHHQFESIHPFPDGNGRLGRILNVLYLTKMSLLEIPILYLSRYINVHKSEYYRLLQSVRDHGNWEAWVLYILAAVAETAQETLILVESIRKQMADVKQRMRAELPKLYSQDLLNSLFRHPYTRIEFIKNDLSVSRQTAAKYLDTLADHKFVEKVTPGRNNYYVNVQLVETIRNS